MAAEDEDKKDDGGIEIELDWIDLALLGAIGVLLVVIVVLLWGSWLRILDMRNWSRWTWCAIVAALAGILAAMRFWPRRR